MERGGVIAIVRLDDYTRAVELVGALADGGVDAVEFTFTNRAAGRAIESAKAAHGDRVLIGAGTVLDPETARSALLQGADFIVTPTLNPATIRLCRRYSAPTVIGAFSPTEIITAWEEGASFVKVFPAGSVGPRYLKDVLGPLPHVKLVPTGGVSLANAGEFIQAGAAAVAVGGNLVDGASVAGERWDQLSARAAEFVAAVRAARA
ncbi:MAG: bifunctional 4-hydroxy-2-oxoglutarate aldolase/2-dehydro-3-deoxy-phosphogluconate aldolase [Chloroflexia bacterium]|nr:bifunctional 4-hydroxy-2-oxoglutarate aldolase/2-dehydro-3-deoxy-phosphogluconate aldolase [Chloroflexia bacterium]